MLRRTMLKGVAACAVAGVLARPAGAQEVLKMGISIPMTGAGFNAVGRQLAAAIKLYVEQHGDTVAGRKIEVILRDDAGVAAIAAIGTGGRRAAVSFAGQSIVARGSEGDVLFASSCRAVMASS